MIVLQFRAALLKISGGYVYFVLEHKVSPSRCLKMGNPVSFSHIAY